MSNKRLLVIRPGGLGDCLLSFPAIESLAAACTHLEVWVPGAVVPLVRFAHKVRSIASTGLDLVGLPGLDAPPKMLEDFHAIISWYGGNRQDFRAATSHLPITYLPSLPPPDSPLHAADFFATQLHAPTPAIPRIKLPAPKRDFVAIHPFSGSPRKNWPVEHFDAVAHALAEPVEWCATPEQELAHRTPALQQSDLGAVAEWLASAKLYIGNDSGITHLAAAVGTPVIALFQASDARIWAPRGPAVRVLHNAQVEEVLAAALSES